MDNYRRISPANHRRDRRDRRGTVMTIEKSLCALKDRWENLEKELDSAKIIC